MVEAPEEEDAMLSGGGEKTIRLVETERLKVIDDQILQLVKRTKGKGIPFAELGSVFAKAYGYTLDPVDYGGTALDEVISSLRHVKVSERTFVQSSLLTRLKIN